MQTLPQKMARNKIKAYTQPVVLIIFRVVHEKRIKNFLDIGYQHFKRSLNFSIFEVKYQSFTKFSIRWPVSGLILEGDG